jgi:hypothetical protein
VNVDAGSESHEEARRAREKSWRSGNSREHPRAVHDQYQLWGAYSLRTRSKERNPADLKGPAESL